jgi:hypothetical protein
MTPPIRMTQSTSMDAGIPPTDAGTDARPQDGGAVSPRGDSAVLRDATPPPPNPTPRTLASSLAQLSAAQRELQRMFSDQNILGPHYAAWNEARNTTYFNMSLAILRTRYYLQGSQTDVSSFRLPLEAWVREAQTSSDPVLRETLPRFLETLRQLQESSTVAQAGTIIGMIEELQQPPLQPVRPPQGPTAPQGPGSPPSTPRTPPQRQRRNPHHEPDAGATPQTTPPPSSPPPQQTGTPPPVQPSSPDAGTPPPPPPRRGRTILPPNPDAGTH